MKMKRGGGSKDKGTGNEEEHSGGERELDLCSFLK